MQSMLQQRSCTLYRLFIIAMLLPFTCYFTYARAADQPQELKITFSGTNVSLGQVFKVIQKQTGYIAMYNVAATKLNTQEKITVHFNSTPLAEVMDFILKGRNLSWQLDDESILIFIKKAEAETPKSLVDSSIVALPLSGKVTDAEGKPVIGATVMVKGTANGTTTDTEGNFTLPKVKNNAALLISSVGYQTREIVVKARSVLAKLNPTVSDLDETVIVAYGTTTKRFNTGNVGSVKAKDIEKQPVNNPLLALQGRVPGLFITQANGVAGGGVTVRIQGQNSIGNGNDPLYIVDGVPFTSQMLATTNTAYVLGTSSGPQGSGSGNPLNYINPADIESIEVLKDADATAIYGSRAANGAILITTKKGKAGPAKIDVSLQQGWGQITRELDVMDTKRYLEMRHEALRNDGVATPSATDYDINGFWDTTRNTNWQKTLLGRGTHYTNINGNISGGTAMVQYLVGATYSRETSFFPGDFADQKGGLHINLNSISSNQKLRFQFSGNYLSDENKLPSVDLGNTAIRLAPDAPALYNADGSLNWALNDAGTATWTNPLAATLTNYQNKTNNLISNAILSYMVLPGLEIKSSFGYNNLETDEFTAYPLSATPPHGRPTALRAASYSNSTINSWIVEPQITYKRSLGEGKFDGLIGTTIQQRNNKGKNFTGLGYNSDLVLEDVHAAATVFVNSTVLSTYKYNALFGRLNYNWKDKYIINLTGRRDGSSRFGSENQFHNFGAVGAAWLFSEEKIIKDNLAFLSFGKLRGSYGTTGNDQIPDYQFLNLYDPVNYGVAYQGGVGLIASRLTNPYLQWEETRKLQVGMELGFLNDRLLLTGNYVHNRSSNQLVEYVLPSVTGFNSILTNFPATVQNTAWELSLNTINLNNKIIRWSSSVNITIPRNKLVAFPDLSSSPYASTLVIGEPISILKAFHLIGIDPNTGIYQIADSHGSPTNTPDFQNDKTVVINTSPKYYGGFENSFSYKGFELDVLFQFVKQINRNAAFFSVYPPGWGWANSNQPLLAIDRWKKPGDLTGIQRYTSSDYNLYAAYSNVQNSDAAFSDASYIRLKNVSLSYGISEKLIKRLHLQHCKIYVHAQNLLTFTNYKGWDPETGGSPTLRIVTAGIKAGF